MSLPNLSYLEIERNEEIEVRETLKFTRDCLVINRFLKKTKKRKRHGVFDTLTLLLCVPNI